MSSSRAKGLNNGTKELRKFLLYMSKCAGSPEKRTQLRETQLILSPTKKKKKKTIKKILKYYMTYFF